MPWFCFPCFAGNTESHDTPNGAFLQPNPTPEAHTFSALVILSFKPPNPPECPELKELVLQRVHKAQVMHPFNNLGKQGRIGWLPWHHNLGSGGPKPHRKPEWVTLHCYGLGPRASDLWPTKEEGLSAYPTRQME